MYGIGQICGGWASAHSGEALEYFTIEKYFDDYKRSHVPQIFCDDIEWLERTTGLPFARQWAYEWRQVMDATRSPYSGFPYYFIDASLRQSGIGGQFSQPQCDVYRSAYLRTLAFAVSEWNMPLRTAVSYSANCLPLNPGLLNVRPIKRPKWLRKKYLAVLRIGR